MKIPESKQPTFRARANDFPGVSLPNEASSSIRSWSEWGATCATCGCCRTKSERWGLRRFGPPSWTLTWKRSLDLESRVWGEMIGFATAHQYPSLSLSLSPCGPLEPGWTWKGMPTLQHIPAWLIVSLTQGGVVRPRCMWKFSIQFLLHEQFGSWITVNTQNTLESYQLTKTSSDEFDWMGFQRVDLTYLTHILTPKYTHTHTQNREKNKNKNNTQKPWLSSMVCCF